MVTYESKQLSFVEVSLGFKEPDLLRRKQFDFEEEFKSFIRGSSMQLPPIPNPVNPVNPVWMMTDDKTRLQATKNTLTIVNNLKAKREDIKCLLLEDIELLSNAVEKILSPSRPVVIKLAGVSQWPSKDPASDVEKDIARRVIKSADEIDLSNANITLSKKVKFREVQAVVSYNIFAYKNVEMKISMDVNKTPPPPMPIVLNETGLFARVEVSMNLESILISSSGNNYVMEYSEGAKNILISCLQNDLPIILDEKNLSVSGT